MLNKFHKFSIFVWLICTSVAMGGHDRFQSLFEKLLIASPIGLMRLHTEHTHTPLH